MSGAFGWSYPPGCTGPPDDDASGEYCGVCLHHVDTECPCEECPTCGEIGRLECFDKDGHMTMTPEQTRLRREGLKTMDEFDQREAQRTEG